MASLGPACNRIRKAIVKLGHADQALVSGAPTPAEKQVALCSDPEDCTSLIESWMGARPSEFNSRAIYYDEVDRELRLVPGSARLYIEKAAARWGYVTARKGKDTILFESQRRSIIF